MRAIPGGLLQLLLQVPQYAPLVKVINRISRAAWPFALDTVHIPPDRPRKWSVRVSDHQTSESSGLTASTRTDFNDSILKFSTRYEDR